MICRPCVLWSQIPSEICCTPRKFCCPGARACVDSVLLLSSPNNVLLTLNLSFVRALPIFGHALSFVGLLCVFMKPRMGAVTSTTTLCQAKKGAFVIPPKMTKYSHAGPNWKCRYLYGGEKKVKLKKS